MMKQKVYFKNLHGFRFIAALLVIITHVELFKKRSGLQNVWSNPFVSEAGSAGVDFFFVLSGFLITSLLLKEIEVKGRIDIKKFYMRRILRIWPLYYLILFICFFLVPLIPIFYYSGYSNQIDIHFWEKLTLSIMFLPNAALAIFKEIPYAAPLWSVGVEEQFYIFWPLLIMFFVRKLRAIMFFILFFIGIKVMLVVLNRIIPIDKDLFISIKEFLVATRMECMGIGGAGAYFVYNKSKVAYFLNRNVSVIIALVLLPFVLVFAQNLFELHHVVLAVLFLIIIVNASTNAQTFINLENKLFHTLGNISYGIYLWHMLVVGAVLNLLLRTELYSSSLPLFNLIMYAVTISITLLVSWVSYNYYEMYFLKWKSKFSFFKTGLEATENKEVKKALMRKAIH